MSLMTTIHAWIQMQSSRKSHSSFVKAQQLCQDNGYAQGSTADAEDELDLAAIIPLYACCLARLFSFLLCYSVIQIP